MGVSDPLATLRTGGDDWSVLITTVNRAQELHFEQRRAELRDLAEGIGVQVGNRVGEIVVKALRAMR